jgi:hypothetical protein
LVRGLLFNPMPASKVRCVDEPGCAALTPPQENTMLKGIALAGIFFLTSAVSTAAVSTTKAKTTHSAPKAPQPQGFCWPSGTAC